MEQTSWNITRAAKLLGLSFRTMQYRLDKFGIKRPSRGRGSADDSMEEEDNDGPEQEGGEDDPNYRR